MISLAPVVISLLLQIPQPSRQPSPTPLKSGSDKRLDTHEVNQKANSNGSASPQAPSAPSSSKSPDADLTCKNCATEGQDHSSKDRWAITLTAMLVIVGGLQVYVYWRQAEYMRRGLHLSIRQTRIATRNAIAAKIAAEAAQVSAKTATDSLLLQSAFIQVSGIGFAVGHIGLPTGAPPTADTSVRVIVKNNGSTRGVNFSVQASLKISPGNQSTILTPPVVYDLAPGNDVGIAFDPFNKWLDDDTIAILKQGRASLHVRLDASYVDIFGRNHELNAEGVFVN